MAAIQTASGAAAAGELGFTSMHEHIAIFATPGIRENYLWNPWDEGRKRALSHAVGKLTAAREAGIETIVDLTTLDLGRDVPFIAEAAHRSGVGVVVASGVFAVSPPMSVAYFHYHGIDHTADLFTRDVEVGVAGTGVRAGVLKCAMQAPLTADQNNAASADGDFDPNAWAVLDQLPTSMWGEFGIRAAARAHRRTGALVNVHSHTAHRTGLLACDVLEEEGVDLSRVLVHHVGDTDDLGYLHALLARGAMLSMDPHRAAWRYDVIAGLCAEGHADRLTLGVDAVLVSDHDPIDSMTGAERERYEEEWAMTYMPTRVVPALRAAGVSDADIDAMTVHNPARFLELSLRTAMPVRRGEEIR